MLRKAAISFLRMITLYLIFATLIISSVPSQSAAMFITPDAGGSAFDSAEDMVKVRAFLESKIVQQRLADFGLTAEEVASRLHQFSPSQLHQMATNIDQIDYGGDSALGVIISILVIAILVIVVLKLMNRQIVIK